jgi:hypothetical protein
MPGSGVSPFADGVQAREAVEMTLPEPRSRAERKADTLAKLRAAEADAWVSSASVSSDGGGPSPYLVPLSFAWIDEQLVIALESTSRTARGIEAHRVARLGLGLTRDVVMIDVVLERTVEAQSAPPELVDRYSSQAGWNPESEGGSYVYLFLRPERIQAWKESNELPGRTLMRAGTWLV